MREVTRLGAVKFTPLIDLDAEVGGGRRGGLHDGRGRDAAGTRPARADGAADRPPAGMWPGGGADAAGTRPAQEARQPSGGGGGGGAAASGGSADQLTVLDMHDA